MTCMGVSSLLLLLLLLLSPTTVPLAAAQYDCNYYEDRDTYRNLRCRLDQYCTFLRRYWADDLSSMTCQGNIQGYYSINATWLEECMLPGQWTDNTALDFTVCYTRTTNENYVRYRQLSYAATYQYTQGFSSAHWISVEYCNENSKQACSCKSAVNNVQCQGCQICNSDNYYIEDCSNIDPRLTETCNDTNVGEFLTKVQDALSQPQNDGSPVAEPQNGGSPSSNQKEDGNSNVVIAVVTSLLIILIVFGLCFGCWWMRKNKNNNKNNNRNAQEDAAKDNAQEPSKLSSQPPQINSMEVTEHDQSDNCLLKEVVKEVIHNADGSTTNKTTVTRTYQDGTKSITEESETVLGC